MPPAARLTDMHTCPMVTGVVPHVGGPIIPPVAMTVMIDFLPAATMTSQAVCVGPPDMVIMGSTGVFINYLPAARLGDPTEHGGVIVLGAMNVMIGETGAPSPGGGGAGAVMAGLVVAGVVNPYNPNPSKLGVPAGSGGGSASFDNSQYADTPTGRFQKSKAFYQSTGMDEDAIVQHLVGIDFSKPVEVVDLEPGTEVKQWVKGGKVGGYFDQDSSPEDLGMLPLDKEPRTLKTFVVNQRTPVLCSTAAPIIVKWVPGVPPTPARGGATQMFAGQTGQKNITAK